MAEKIFKNHAMSIGVNLGGKNYGGYIQSEYTVTLSYYNMPWGDIVEGIDFPMPKDFAKRVEGALLGKRTTSNIKFGSSGEVIVYKGEAIAKLRIQKIIENWYDVDFGKSSLADKIKKLRR